MMVGVEIVVVEIVVEIVMVEIRGGGGGVGEIVMIETVVGVEVVMAVTES